MDFVTEAMLCKVFRPGDGKPVERVTITTAPRHSSKEAKKQNVIVLLVFDVVFRRAVECLINERAGSYLHCDYSLVVDESATPKQSAGPELILCPRTKRKNENN